jgi:hypothetical protein
MRSIFSWRAASAAVGLFGLVVMGLAQSVPTPTYTADGSNLDGHATGPVLDLRVSPNGQFLASVVAVPANAGGAEVRVRNAQTGAFLWSATLGPLPEAGLPRVAFTPDSSRLYFVQTNGSNVESVVAVNPSTGASITSFTDGDSDFFRSRVVINAAGTQYAYQAGDNRTGSTRRRIVIRNVSNNSNAQQIIIGGSGSSSDIRDFNFTPSGTEMVIALAGGNVYRKLQVAPETEVSLGFAGAGVNRIERFGSSTDLLFATTSTLERRAFSNGALVRNYTNVPAGGVTGLALFGTAPNGEPVAVGAVGAFNFPTFVKLDDGAVVDQFDLRRTGEAATDSRMNGIGWTGTGDMGIVFGSNAAASPATRVLRVTASTYTLGLNPATVIGGNGSTGTVTLPVNAPVGGLAISLTSTAGVTVPATVTVPAGVATADFAITTTNTDADSVGSVTAHFPFGSAVQNLTRQRVAISSLVLARETIGNTQAVTGTVTLNIAPTANRTVALAVSPPGAGSVPATVEVLAGSNTANFTFTPTVTETNVNATITGTLNSTTADDTVQILATQLRAVEIYPYNARAGQRIAGIVRLTTAAAEETTVTITSGNPAVLANQQVVIPAGSSFGRFTATLGSPTARTTVSLVSNTAYASGATEARSNVFYVAIPANLIASGKGTEGQMGDGVLVNELFSLRPPRIEGTAVKAVGGATTTHYLLAGGTVRAAGLGTQGQIGNGTSGAGASFILPTLLGLTGITDIASGLNHVLAVDNQGRLRAWGRNAEGQLGDGTTTQRNSPTLTGSLGLVKVAAGETHSIAINTNGDVYVWGTGLEGQLGLGATTQALVPTNLPMVGPFVDVAAGRHHSLVLHADGTVYAFGRNDEGQLGLGDNTDRNVPTALTALTSEVRAIEGGGFHTLFLTVPAYGGAARIFAAGLATSGQLGVAVSPSTRSTPVQAASGTFLAIAAGDRHSVALNAGGQTFTFGGNQFGQISNGTTTDRISLFGNVGHIPAAFITAGTNATFSVRTAVQTKKESLLMVDTTARTFATYNFGTQTATPLVGSYPAGLMPFAGGVTGSPNTIAFMDTTTRKVWTSVVNTTGWVLQAPVERSVTIPANETPLTLADFSGDGLGDIITVDTVTNEIKAHIWNGNTLTSTVVLYTLVNESFAGAEDMNGDNRADLIIKNNTTRVLRFRRYNLTAFVGETPLQWTTGLVAGGHLAHQTVIGPGELAAARMQEIVFLNNNTGNFEQWNMSRMTLFTKDTVVGTAPAGMTPLNFWR